LGRDRRAGGALRHDGLGPRPQGRLDATSFNKSKRTSPDGRDRWPSTESVAKVLRATGATPGGFPAPGGARRRAAPSMVPLIGMTQAGAGKFFTDDGLPTGGPGWDEIDFPISGRRRCSPSR
jgi:phage repressor protein C with HTH and peptisase S24 domain